MLDGLMMSPWLLTLAVVGGLIGGVALVAYATVRQRRQLADMANRLSLVLDERRRTDMALREADSRLQDVLEGTVLGILIHRNLRPLYVNSSLTSILGYKSRGEFFALRSCLDFIIPAERNRVRDFFVSADKESLFRDSHPFETRAVRQDGVVLWLEMGARSILWGGEPVSFVTISDISERKLAEEALRRSESRLSRAQNIAHLGHWEFRYDAGGLWWSDETYRIFGRDPATFQPSFDAFLETVHEDDRQRVEDAVAAARHGGAPYDLDHRIVTPDGSIRHVHEQGELRRSVSGGGDDVMFGTVHDITERMISEQALRESERRHRDFAADVAHELRTPLSVMRAKLDNMEQEPSVLSLREGVVDMTRLVVQLLDASRADLLTIAPDEVADLRSVCVSVASQLAPLAIQRGRDIELVGAEGPVPVWGNANALEQAVRNMVDNAIKYSDPRTTITIRVYDTPPGVSVIDQGKPVPEGMQRAIFSRFTRADRRAGGTGLGLSIVQRITEAHGAEVFVGDPEGGEGACFTLRFPPTRP